MACWGLVIICSATPAYAQMVGQSTLDSNQYGFEQDLNIGTAFDSLEDLQALLPEHLRTPLPLARDKVAKVPIYIEERHAEASKGDETSSIEQFYRRATGTPNLKQQGYDYFKNAGTRDVTPAGMVQDQYILGTGDRLNIAFTGERKDKGVYRVNNNGQINIDQLPHIAAMGKTLESLRTDIRHLLDAQGYHGDVLISLEGIRQISVLVAGHVDKPGRHQISALHSPLEAIEQAGGILKTGSLRQVKLIRGGKSTTIDLYRVLGLQGGAQVLPPIQDGDRILVPPMGQSFAITGDVRQAGIYEMPLNRELSTAQGIELAGGTLSYGQNRTVLMLPRSDGQRVVHEVSIDSKMGIKDGGIVTITRGEDLDTASITLAGEVRNPGTYAVAQYKKLSSLLGKAQAFGDDVYPLMGVISRRRSKDLARDLIAFSPQDIYLRRADMELREGDQIRLFSRADVTRIMDKEMTTNIPALVAGFVREHSVSLQGAVRVSGTWPLAAPTRIAAVLDMAGGATTDGDVTRIEIMRNDTGLILASGGSVARRDVINLTDVSADKVEITAGDSVRVPDRFEAVTRHSITLLGEVRNPGTYDLMRGDTLLSVIERAGGMTDQAYPLGAVFSRAAERKREKEKFASAARDLERSIAMAAKGDDGKVDMAQMALAKELVDELKTIEPAGRITVQADPSVLRQDPAQDILMEAGDRVYVPKRPLSVRVTGEVLSPAALQFRADKKPTDYMTEAGGTTHHADRGRIFVLFPDGSAQPLAASTWTSVKPVMIIPGSTIVVPRDPKPFSFIDSAKDITQILSNLAITGIYADDLINRRK